MMLCLHDFLVLLSCINCMSSFFSLLLFGFSFCVRLTLQAMIIQLASHWLYKYRVSHPRLSPDQHLALDVRVFYSLMLPFYNAENGP